MVLESEHVTLPPPPPLLLLCGPSISQVVHVSHKFVEMKEPYIPGFLAFREVGFLLDRLNDVRRNFPQYRPQVSTGYMYRCIPY